MFRPLLLTALLSAVFYFLLSYQLYFHTFQHEHLRPVWFAQKLVKWDMMPLENNVHKRCFAAGFD